MSTPNWKFDKWFWRGSFPLGVQVGSWVLFTIPGMTGNLPYEDKILRVSHSGQQVKFKEKGWWDISDIRLCEALTGPTEDEEDQNEHSHP